MTPNPHFFYQRYWHRRIDGIRQRYWQKVEYVRPSRMKEFFRATVAVNNVPISNRLHHFSVSKIDKTIDLDALKEQLLYYMEAEIGYSQDDWWFSPVFGIEYPTPIEALAPDIYFQHRVGRKS